MHITSGQKEHLLVVWFVWKVYILKIMTCGTRFHTALYLLAGLLMAGQARAVLYYDDAAAADPNHNTTAPTGTYADSGWQYEGQFGTFLGTMIAPQYFITAQHIGVQGTSFVSTAAFNGTANINYTVDTSANSGVGYWDIAGTDFRIFKINETFSQWAPLYTGTTELGATVVTNGLGGPRGAAVTVDYGLGPQLDGWKLTPGGTTAHWGTNQISSIIPDAFSPVGSLLAAEFNALPGTDESFLSGGDSGAGLFIKDGGVWKLAGVNYGIEGNFDTNNTTGDSSEFTAALFDKSGLYEGSDASGWTYQTPLGGAKPIDFYASRISDSIPAIASIAVVPEPSSLLLLAAGAFVLQGRRRRLPL